MIIVHETISGQRETGYPISRLETPFGYRYALDIGERKNGTRALIPVLESYGAQRLVFAKIVENRDRIGLEFAKATHDDDYLVVVDALRGDPPEPIVLQYILEGQEDILRNCESAGVRMWFDAETTKRPPAPPKGTRWKPHVFVDRPLVLARGLVTTRVVRTALWFRKGDAIRVGSRVLWNSRTGELRTIDVGVLDAGVVSVKELTGMPNLFVGGKE